MKECSTCEVTKLLSAFPRHGKTKDGYSNKCTACMLERLARIRAERRIAGHVRLEQAGGKECTRCRQHVLPEGFGAREASVDGRDSICNRCRSTRTEEQKVRFASNARCYYQRNPELMRARARNWNLSNPEKSAELQKRSQVRRRTITWMQTLAQGTRRRDKQIKYGPSDIDVAFIRELFEHQGGKCYWLGIPLVPSEKNRDPRRPSLDRLDNSKGYVRGNVVLTCQFANMGRSQLDAASFQDFIRELLGHLRNTTP